MVSSMKRTILIGVVILLSGEKEEHLPAIQKNQFGVVTEFMILLAMRRRIPKIVKIPKDIPMSSETNRWVGPLSREDDVSRKSAPKRWAKRISTIP